MSGLVEDESGQHCHKVKCSPNTFPARLAFPLSYSSNNPRCGSGPVINVRNVSASRTSEEIPEPVLEQIHGLWDALASASAANSEQALLGLLGAIASLINARNAWWISAVRLGDSQAADGKSKSVTADDPYLGWRPTNLVWLQETPALRQAFKDQAGKVKPNPVAPNESTLNHLKQAGRFRATLMKDHVTTAHFDSPVYKAIYTDLGFSDALFIVAPTNQDVEVYFCFLRANGQPDFEPLDLAIARYALRSLLWFHRQVLLSFGVHLGAAPLTPTERRVLNLLLTANSEAEIAKLLSQSRPTTHQHITRIFRKFNVSSRAALTALWLGSF